jgi:iron complex transport system ATP-binding protein
VSASLAPGQVPSASPAAAPAIELRGVGLDYGPRHVLHDIDLAVPAGSRLALVGPNGAGKSTLLRCLTGVARGRLGHVWLGGVLIEELGRAGVARRIAVVPQQAVLPFSMAVEEVVALGRIPHEDPFRGPREADRAAVRAAIERVGISALADRDVRELSLGERQLVLIAMAVAQQAPILVLDEPTVHLDLGHQVRAMELLCDLNERDGSTIVAVLHDLGLAHAFFPRLVLLDGGRIVADGPPTEVLTRHRIREVFGVDPALVPSLVPSPGPGVPATHALEGG